MDKITEIRVEEIFDEENNQHYYWIYYYKNDEVKIIGKSSVKPQCYRQNCEVRKMSNYYKNKLKERLTYCQDWKHSIDMYLANKEITKQADEEFYKSRPF